MARDFAKKKKTKPKPRIPFWVWAFSSLTTIGFIGFLTYLATVSPNSEKTFSEKKSVTVSNERKDLTRDLDDKMVATAQSIKKLLSIANTKPSKPNLDFYHLLPNREVEIDAKPDTPTNQGNISYILQAGSFHYYKDADRRRAELLLLGLETKITSSNASDGKTWHRVMVGPFKTRSRMAKVRSTLINIGINTLTIKNKIG